MGLEQKPTDKEIENLSVYVSSERPKIIISPRFLTANDAWNNLEAIKEMFHFKYCVFELIQETNDPAELRAYGQDLTEIEFCIQKLFNFKADIKFHRFWEAPKCTCPAMDNQDWWGTDRNIISGSCPLHYFEKPKVEVADKEEALTIAKRISKLIPKGWFK